MLYMEMSVALTSDSSEVYFNLSVHVCVCVNIPRVLRNIWMVACEFASFAGLFFHG